AEDGIRDYKVTGVQTCALPIFDGGGKDVTGTAFRPDQLRSGALGLDLLAQPSHLHIDGAVVHLVVVQARELQKLLAREHALRRRSEERRVGKGWRARWVAQG